MYKRYRGGKFLKKLPSMSERFRGIVRRVMLIFFSWLGPSNAITLSASTDWIFVFLQFLGYLRLIPHTSSHFLGVESRNH